MTNDQTPNPLFTLTHHAWLASEFREIILRIPHATDRMTINSVISHLSWSLEEDNPQFNKAAWLQSITNPVEPTTGLPGDLEDHPKCK